jgi:hypothetical protein
VRTDTASNIRGVFNIPASICEDDHQLGDQTQDSSELLHVPVATKRRRVTEQGSSQRTEQNTSPLSDCRLQRFTSSTLAVLSFHRHPGLLDKLFPPPFQTKRFVSISHRPLRQAVAHLLRTLCYKSEGCGFDSIRDYCSFNCPYSSCLQQKLKTGE